MADVINTVPELTTALVGRGFHRVEGDTLIAPDDQIPEPGCWSYRADSQTLLMFVGLSLPDLLEGPFPVIVRCVHAPDSDEFREMLITIFPGDCIALLGWWPRMSLSLILQFVAGVVRTWLISESKDPQFAEKYDTEGRGDG